MHPTRIFKHPDELEAQFELYRQSLTERAKQWPQVQYVGKDGERVVDYPKLPLTQDGFEIFSRSHQYFINKDELYGDFVPICRVIKQIIRDDQITGGLLGEYNPSITQRLNGLKESTDINLTSVNILNIDPLDDGK